MAITIIETVRIAIAVGSKRLSGEEQEETLWTLWTLWGWGG